MTGQDGEARSLSSIFKRLIANHGPISILQFMGESNARYYDTRDPFGAQGDFITAPEISQMFGELIGLWLADMWDRAGRPTPVHYVELGPGRGTLARDALRAARQAGLDPQVHLIESSTVLRNLQRELVPQGTWHHDLSTVPSDGPMLLVANEFLDALPVRQLVRTQAGWRERMVGLQDGGFAFVAGDQPMEGAIPADMRAAPDGTILEVCPGAVAVVGEIASRLAKQGGAALLIDYGYASPQTGSTLQALREHRKVDPLAMPGEADITAHVDFAALVPVALSQGARWLGTATQGQWLERLGIALRAESLARAVPHQREAVHAAMNRLIGDAQMGALFKVMGLAGSDWPDGAGF